METAPSLPGFIDGAPEDLALINLQDLYKQGHIRFDQNSFKPLTIADRINERPFVYNMKPSRAAML